MQMSPTVSAWAVMSALRVQILPDPVQGSQGGEVRFLAQWKGRDSCLGPLPVGGRQLCPLKPEPWCPTAEPGGSHPSCPSAGSCRMESGWGGTPGSGWGLMEMGGDVGSDGVSAHCKGSRGDGAVVGGSIPFPNPPHPECAAQTGIAGLVPPHPLWETPLPATTEHHRTPDT